MKNDLVQEKTRIACIGTGMMGAPVAAHLMRSGYHLTVHDRRQQIARPLLDSGAAWAKAIPDLSGEAQVIITTLGTPDNVREVYLGAGGLLETAREGSLLIDMTTSCPELAREIHARALERGIHVVDAPASGGQKGAIEGRLCIHAGGDEAACVRAGHILRAVGTTHHVGGPGAGQSMKLASLMGMAVNISGALETLAFARAGTLDLPACLECLSHGPGSSWALQSLAPRLVRDDAWSGPDLDSLLGEFTLARTHAHKKGIKVASLDTALDCLGRIRNELGAQPRTHEVLELLSTVSAGT